MSIENNLKKKLIPSFIRYLKEKDLYPNILYKDIEKNLTLDVKECMLRFNYDRRKIGTINSICDFEIYFFEHNDFCSISPLGKNRKQCKEEKDILEYILFFTLNDIIDGKKLYLKENIDKISFIKEFISDEEKK